MDIKKSFEILRLEPDASPDDIRQAYRDLVNVWHPDRFLNNPRLQEKAAHQLLEINLAYETIITFVETASKSSAQQPEQTGKPEASPPHTRSKFHRFRFPRKITLALPTWLARILARMLDNVILALALGYMEVFRLFPASLTGAGLCMFAIMLLWAFIEANLLSMTGTTPGKWMLNMRVVNRHGNAPVLLEAFKRSMALWWYGLGAGCIPITLLTLPIVCSRLARNLPARWDVAGRFVVIFGHRTWARTIGAILTLLLGIFLVMTMWVAQHSTHGI